MKKAELQSLIKESIREVLIEQNLITEKFASKKVQDMYNKINKSRWSGDKKFFQAASKTYNIEWDKVTDDMISGPTPRMKRKGLEFLLSTKDQRIAGSGRYDYPTTVSKGQILGVAMNGKAVYFGSSEALRTGAPGFKGKGKYIGLDKIGLQNADSIIKKVGSGVEVYQVDISKASGAGDVRKGRQDARRDATALMKFGDIKNQNKMRYEKALVDRLAKSSPVDQAWKMLEATQKMLEAIYKKDLEMLKSKKMVADSWRSEGSIIKNTYSVMWDNMQRLLTAENTAIKSAEKEKANKLKKGDKDAWSEEKYYLKEMVKYARNIQSSYKEMKQKLSKMDKDKQYYSIVR